MSIRGICSVALALLFVICETKSQDAQQQTLPLMGPSSAAFPLRNSYVPQAVSFASPAYVFASYSSGGYRLQGQVEGGESEDEGEEKRRKFMMYRRFH